MQAFGTVSGGALGFLVMPQPTTTPVSVLRARQQYFNLMTLLDYLPSSCLCGGVQVALQAAGTISGGDSRWAFCHAAPATATQPLTLVAQLRINLMLLLEQLQLVHASRH